MNGRNAVWVLTPEDIIASAKDGQRYDEIYITTEDALSITSEIKRRGTSMLWELMDKIIDERYGCNI